jgi:hypothetical protein
MQLNCPIYSIIYPRPQACNPVTAIVAATQAKASHHSSTGNSASPGVTGKGIDVGRGAG